VIAKLQRLDPPGIFARSLTECLSIQLRESNRLDPVMETMLQNIELMGKGDTQGLRKLCGVDEEDFAQMIADLRHCNPKPASGFLKDEAAPVIPDVLVRRGRGGAWLVELNSEALPRLLVNRQYAGEVGGRAAKETKKIRTLSIAITRQKHRTLDSLYD
jgi:RNA polymerase sigma-54 factor